MVGVDRSHGVGRELYFFFFGEGWNGGILEVDSLLGGGMGERWFGC